MLQLNRGFSAIESITSVFLLSILIIMTAGILPQAIKCSKKSSLSLSASNTAISILSLAEEGGIPDETFKSGIYPLYNSPEEALKGCPETDLRQLLESKAIIGNTGKILMHTERYSAWLWYMITYRLTAEEPSDYSGCPIALADISIEAWWNEEIPSAQEFSEGIGMKKIMYTKRIITEKRKN